MSASDIATLSRLLDQGLELGIAEREAWLATLHGHEPHLIDKLREMLATTSDTRDGAAFLTLPRLGSEEAAAQAGERVGAYRLIREIGRGGMGSVWLAERADGSYERQVALKLPRLTWTGGLAERMARERRIGALLEHPHIARMYDAGVDEHGRPYIAMEYIDGVSIDAWCEQQTLDTAARLKLFVQVVRAVAHAHGLLVVHRDLKPANVMVDKRGQARLLDFGIAKLLADTAPGSDVTLEQGRAMTPGYAAPEQIAGQPAGVAADIYSLGVLLYELLTGTRPFGGKGQSSRAIEDAVLRGDAPPASSRAPDASTARALRGEVDAILGKAMKREPAQRYATAHEFAEDIERHLRGETVTAKADTPWYRLRKAAVRHRFGVVASAAVLVTLVGGSVATLVQAHRVQQQVERTRLTTGFVTELLRDQMQAAVPGQPGASGAAFVDRGARLIESRFSGEPEIKAQLFGEVGKIYADMGASDLSVRYLKRQIELLDVQGSGNAERARATLLLARALRGEDETQAVAQLNLAIDLAKGHDRLRAECMAFLAGIMAYQGKLKEANQLIDDAGRLLALNPGPPDLALSHLYFARATVISRMPDHADRWEEELRLREMAVESALRVEGPQSPQAVSIREGIVIIHAQHRRADDARRVMHETMAAVRNTGGAGEVTALRVLANCWVVLNVNGLVTYAEVTAALKDIQSLSAERAAIIPPGLRARIDFLCSIAWLEMGDVAKAATMLEAIRPQLDKTDNRWLRFRVLGIESQLAAATGQHQKAMDLLREFQSLNDALVGGATPSTNASFMLGMAEYLNMAGMHEKALSLLASIPAVADKYSKREAVYSRTRVELDAGLPVSATEAELMNNEPDFFLDRGGRPQLVGEMLCATGPYARGLEVLKAAMSSREPRFSPVDPGVARARALAGLCALKLRDRTEARRLADLARQAFAAQPDVSPWFKARLSKLDRALGI